MKKCNKCNILKDDKDFYRPNRSSTCKLCHLEMTRIYKKEKRQSEDYRIMECHKQKERRIRLWQNTLINDCKHRGLEINIDIEYINYLFENQQGKCYWFGVDLIPSSFKKHPQQPSLDRLNNKLGYVKGNVVLSCYSANIGRNENEQDVWIEFIKHIKPNIY